jgi:hypothetical protein
VVSRSALSGHATSTPPGSGMPPSGICVNTFNEKTSSGA